MTVAPLRLVRALLSQLPALLAGDSLRRVSELQVGGGLMKNHESRRRLREWEREANGGVRPRATPATRAELEAMGISVVTGSD